MQDFKKIWSKRHSLRLGENWSFGPLQFEKIFGIKFPNQVIVYQEGFGYGFVDNDMLKVCHTHLIGEIYRKGFDEYFEKRALPVFESFLNFSKHICRFVTGASSNFEIHKLWKEFIQREDEWMNYVWMVFLLDEGLTNELQKKLQEVQFDDMNRLLPAMVAPASATAASRLKKELLVLASAVRLGKDVTADLQRLATLYGYFAILNMDETPLGTPYFQDEIDDLVCTDVDGELGKLDQNTKDMAMLYEEVKVRCAAHPPMLLLIEACRKVAYYREYRNDIRQESYYYARHLYLEIAKRSGIEVGDLIFATRNEIENFLLNKEKIREDIVASRKALSAIISDYQKSEVRYEFDHNAIVRLWPREDADVPTRQLRGIVAYQGIARGKVKVIFDPTKQGHDFETGTILVTTTTNLSFVPLMRKAAAIITDEGGMLTHAAIVAREFGKVAIVGCKIATKVLHDGDFVEVDAHQGIVTILQHQADH